MTQSPGQWAPWISDPDPPEEPMTPEQSKAAALATRDLVPVPAPSDRARPTDTSSNRQGQTSQEIYDEILETVLRNNPSLTREEAQAMLAHYI
jgi:hypothetical protein